MFRDMDRTWPVGMAIAGLGIMGIVSVAIAPTSVVGMTAILDRSSVHLQSIVTQAILVGGIVLVVATGLAGGSRIAYVAALLLGLLPAAWWLSLVIGQHPIAFEPMTVRLVAPTLLILAGLGLAWPAFWQRDPNDPA